MKNGIIAQKVEEGLLRQHREYPVHVNRASSLGHPCERYLYYQRTAHEKRELPDVGLLAIWEEGVAQERTTAMILSKFAGLELIEGQRELTIKEHNIVGHIDGKVVPILPEKWPDWPKADPEKAYGGSSLLRAVPIEIKSMNSYSYESIQTLDDMINSDRYWIRGYVIQLQLYLAAMDEPVGVFILKDKNAARVKDIWMERDDKTIEEVFEKADRIEEAVKTGVPPERNEGSHCRRCPFLTLCTPDFINPNGAEIINNEELESLLKRRQELLDAGKELNGIERQIKNMLEGVHRNIMCGDWLITGKTVQRKGFTVAPSEIWRRKIEYIGEKEEK